MGNELTALERTTATRDAIRAKLDGARADLETLDSRRRELSFDAHSEGGAAKKELDGLHKLRAIAVGEIESLEIAIIEASRRIADAERDEELGVECEKAARALVLEREATKLMIGMDRDMEGFATKSNRMTEIIRELNFQIGCPSPNQHQHDVLGAMAFKAHAMKTPYRIEHLAPRDRRSFAELWSGWRQGVLRFAEERLPVKEAAE